jgi:hypothetical protein
MTPAIANLIDALAIQIWQEYLAEQAALKAAGEKLDSDPPEPQAEERRAIRKPRKKRLA